MPTYRVRSGELDIKFKALEHLEPIYVAMAGVIMGHRDGFRYGEIIEIKGGKYRGMNVTYMTPGTVFKVLDEIKK